MPCPRSLVGHKGGAFPLPDYFLSNSPQFSLPITTDHISNPFDDAISLFSQSRGTHRAPAGNMIEFCNDLTVNFS